jgi:hypothetical protein
LVITKVSNMIELSEEVGSKEKEGKQNPYEIQKETQ